jgi:dolichol-phosphate mannosyltransferase
MGQPGDPSVRSRRDVVSPQSARKTSIILATLNERSNLPAVIERIRKLGLARAEILVVDDGSVDGTREYVAALAEHDPSIRLLRHDGKQTTLRAQCQGIEAAAGDSIVIMDADLQHPPEAVPQLLAALEQGAAVAIASRYAPGGSAGPRTLKRWAYSRGAEWLTRLALPSARHVTDPVSGYFAFRKEIWMPLNPLYRGYKLLLFVLVMAEGRPIREVGFSFTPRPGGSSKVTGNYSFIRVFLVELLLARRLRSRMRCERRPPGGASSSAQPVSVPR